MSLAFHLNLKPLFSAGSSTFADFAAIPLSKRSISIFGNCIQPTIPLSESNFKYTKLSPYLQVFLVHIGKFVSISNILLNKSAKMDLILFDSE